MLVQDDGRTRQQGPGGLVSRHQQRQEKHEQLLLAERASPDLAADEQGDQILARSGPLGPDVLDDESRQLTERGHGLVGRQVGRFDGGVRPTAKVLPIRLVDPEELRDHDERERRGESGDEVDLVPGLGGIEQRRRGLADRLGQARQGPGRETSVDQPAEGGVLRRIHVQDRAGRHTVLAAPHRVIDERTLPRAEVTGVAAEIPDVLVAADRPETRCALVDGILVPQLRQHVVVVVPEEERPVPRVDSPQADLAPLVPGHAPSVLCFAMRRSLFERSSIDGR